MGIRMYGLQLGHVGMDIEMLLTGHPKYMLMPGEPIKPKVRYQCPCLAYIIEHPEGRILFETGVSPHWREEWPKAFKFIAEWDNLRPEDFLEARLKALGLGPEDFRYVIMGHMHMDHAGGLRLFEDANVEIVLHEDEHRGILNLERDEHGFSRADFAFLPRKRPTLVYGNQEFLKDVILVSLPGHTWGSLGMLVRLERTGWVFFTSDALHHHESYGPPRIGSMTHMFPDRALESMEKIRRFATRYEALIVPGHDETGIRQRKEGPTELVELQYYPGHVYE